MKATINIEITGKLSEEELKARGVYSHDLAYRFQKAFAGFTQYILPVGAEASVRCTVTDNTVSEERSPYRVPSREEWIERYSTKKRLAGYKAKDGE